MDDRAPQRPAAFITACDVATIILCAELGGTTAAEGGAGRSRGEAAFIAGESAGADRRRANLLRSLGGRDLAGRLASQAVHIERARCSSGTSCPLEVCDMQGRLVSVQLLLHAVLQCDPAAASKLAACPQFMAATGFCLRAVPRGRGLWGSDGKLALEQVDANELLYLTTKNLSSILIYLEQHRAAGGALGADPAGAAAHALLGSCPGLLDVLTSTAAGPKADLFLLRAARLDGASLPAAALELIAALVCVSKAFASDLLASPRPLLVLLTLMRGDDEAVAAAAAVTLVSVLTKADELGPGAWGRPFTVSLYTSAIRSMAAGLCVLHSRQHEKVAGVLARHLVNALNPPESSDASGTAEILAAGKAALAAEAAARPALLPTLVRMAAAALRPPSSESVKCALQPLYLVDMVCSHAEVSCDCGLLQRIVQTPGMVAMLAETLQAGRGGRPVGRTLVKLAALSVHTVAKGGDACMAALCAEPRLLPNLALAARGPRMVRAAGGESTALTETAATALAVLCASCGMDPSAWDGNNRLAVDAAEERPACNNAPDDAASGRAAPVTGGRHRHARKQGPGGQQSGAPALGAPARDPAGSSRGSGGACSVCARRVEDDAGKLRTCSVCRKPGLRYCGVEW